MGTASNTDHQITLADGRNLGYALYGSPTGLPVLFFHGTPGSRLSIFADMSNLAAQKGIRIIAPDRPGYGLSSFAQRESALVYSADICELLDVLKISQCHLLGFSMGSLAAFACAFALPERIHHLTLVGALAPLDINAVAQSLTPISRELFNLARTDQHAFTQVLSSIADSPANLVTAMEQSMSPIDQALICTRRLDIEADFTATLATGIQGFINDYVLAAKPWGFPVADIRCPVDLWIGSEDTNTPPAMTDYAASQLKQSNLYQLQGEGHCLLYTQWASILDSIVTTQNNNI